MIRVEGGVAIMVEGVAEIRVDVEGGAKVTVEGVAVVRGEAVTEIRVEVRGDGCVGARMFGVRISTPFLAFDP